MEADIAPTAQKHQPLTQTPDDRGAAAAAARTLRDFQRVGHRSRLQCKLDAFASSHV